MGTSRQMPVDRFSRSSLFKLKILAFFFNPSEAGAAVLELLLHAWARGLSS